MRLVIADCTVDYAGRLSAHLPRAVRLLMVKADGSVSIHADGRAYKPLNWMSPPCTLAESLPQQRGSASLNDRSLTAEGAASAGDDNAAGEGNTVRESDDAIAESGNGTADAAEADGIDTLNSVAIWTVTNKAGETLTITLHAVHHDSSHELGEDPGLQKDGVEAHLQVLLAEHVSTFGDGWSLIRREYPTAIGPVDLLCRDGAGLTVAVEIKRRGEIDGVEQLTRYLELLNRDPVLAPVSGVFAAQEIKPQARTLAEDRGIRCLVVDYDALRGIDDSADKLF